MDSPGSIKYIMGLKLRSLRISKGYSFSELASKTGLSVSYLNELEKGKKYPKGDKILLLSSIYGISYDELVSLQVPIELQPIVDLLNSDIMQEFPLEIFGLEIGQLVELLAGIPDKAAAFINTLNRFKRNLELNKDYFFQSALRSWQEMHLNYFPEIEAAAIAYRRLQISWSSVPKIEELKQSLYQLGIQKIDHIALGNNPALTSIRSFWNESSKCLYLHPQLHESQLRFQLAREIGYQVLGLKVRSAEAPPSPESRFEILLSNFKASYFAVALLMEENRMLRDIRKFALSTSWSPENFLELLDRYKATPEMLMQRLTNLLPIHFGIKNLFFLRFTEKKGSNNFIMTKDLHLNRPHQPHGNSLNEHYCRRWVSHRILQNIPENSFLHAQAQRSFYYQSETEYLCLSIAQKVGNQSNSITIGFLIEDTLKNTLKFINDPFIKREIVHTTCERCSLKDCTDRVSEASVLIQEQNELKKKEALNQLLG